MNEYVLLFMGSPRTGGNTDLLADAFLEGASAAGAETRKVNLYSSKIGPCIECGGCDETGRCILKDDMTELYDDLARATVVVVASPMFFYNITSKTQALVERSQALWMRKYALKQDMGHERKGAFLSVGATKGKLLFEGSIRVVRYFMDAIGGRLVASLLLRQIEGKGDVKNHPTALDSARQLGRAMVLDEGAAGIEDVVVH